MILFAKQKWRHSYREHLCGYQEGIGIDIYTLVMLCMKYVTNETILYTQTLYPMPCSDLNGKETQKREATWTQRVDSPAMQ